MADRLTLTLRHYDDIGLLKPSSIGANGYRRYDEDLLARLQRILLLRELGFDHTEYKDEVEERWGMDAYAKSDSWYRSLSPQEASAFKQRSDELAFAWIDAATSSNAADSDVAQQVAQRRFDWLRSIPGTPRNGNGDPTKQYFTWMADMYVADERFAVNYGGQAGAEFVRDAMVVFAEKNL